MKVVEPKKNKGGRKSPSKTHQSLIFPMPLQRWEVGGKGESQITLSSRQFAFVVVATCQKRLYKTFGQEQSYFYFSSQTHGNSFPFEDFLFLPFLSSQVNCN